MLLQKNTSIHGIPPVLLVYPQLSDEVIPGTGIKAKVVSPITCPLKLSLKDLVTNRGDGQETCDGGYVLDGIIVQRSFLQISRSLLRGLLSSLADCENIFNLCLQSCQWHLRGAG
jgi:hypothetical protein